MALNESEAFAAKICQTAFLRLWCYENPRSTDPRHELCDILIVCDPHVIIVSVKERAFFETDDLSTGWERWTRKVADRSRKQIAGAERQLDEMSHVIRSDNTHGLSIPPASRRRVHRVVVAVGGNDSVPINAGDHGSGFVHIFDEKSFEFILAELDTISDFTGFLDDLEAYLEETQVVVAGIENLLAVYLRGGRKLPSGATHLMVEDDFWEDFTSRPEVKAKREADKISFVWDELIERFSSEVVVCSKDNAAQLNEIEPAIRTMAMESRFSRRMLAEALIDFLKPATSTKRARMLCSERGTAYVFLADDGDRQDRIDELRVRMFVARGLTGTNPVVGIAWGYPPGPSSSIDLGYLNQESWDDSDTARLSEVQEKTQFFVACRPTETSNSEYPDSQGTVPRPDANGGD